MTDLEKNIVKNLNNLLVVNHDARKGYHNAIGITDNNMLKFFFQKKFEQRSNFILEIHRHIKKLGGEPVEGGSIAGQAHRTWMDLKSLLTGQDEEAILDACETGEQVALETYDDCLKIDGLSHDLISALTLHRAKIAKSLRSVENLEESFEAVA